MEQEIDVEKLLEVISDQQSLLTKINEKQKQNVILLIGNTGSGKSFLFNWMSGAEFEFDEENAELKLKQEQRVGLNLSAQSSSSNSVTKIPHFNKIDDHLLIDFPGFKDTKGKYERLSIKLMFDEIVTKTNVKIAVVLNQPKKEFPARATGIQELIKSTFTTQNTKFESIGLIINQFQEYPQNEPKDEQKIIQNFQSQLKGKSQCEKEFEHVYQALSQQIIIVDQFKKKNIQQVNQEDLRNSVIAKLKKISEISYKPDYEDENKVVDSYIKSELQKIFKSYNQILLKQKEDAKSKKLEDFITTLKDDIKKMNAISQHDCDGQTQWIKDLILKLQLSKDEQEIYTKFLCIFQYFFKYKENISGYENFQAKKNKLKLEKTQFIKELEDELNRQNIKKALEEKELEVIKAKNKQEEQKREHQLEIIQKQNEYNLALDEQKSNQTLVKEQEKNKQEELKQIKANEDQKHKDEVDLLKKQITEQKQIFADNDALKKKKEKDRQDLRVKIGNAEATITALNKEIQTYQQEQDKLYPWKRDDTDTKKKQIDPKLVKIQQQEQIINTAKSDLIYLD